MDVAPCSIKFVPLSEENRITDIDRGAFSMMTVMGGVRFALPVDNIGERVFLGTSIQGTLAFEDVGMIGERAFQRATIHHLKFGNVDTIGKYAFYEAYIDDFEVGDFRIMEDHAFEASYLGGIHFSDKIEKIGSAVFKNCDKLKNIWLPESTGTEKEVAEDAFPDRSSLTVHIPGNFHDYDAYHLNNYKNVIYCIDAAGEEDVAEAEYYMKQNGLSYKLGETGEVTTGSMEAPEYAVSPVPAETSAAGSISQIPEGSQTVQSASPVPEGSLAASAAAVTESASGIKKGNTFTWNGITYKVLSKGTVTVTGKKKKSLKVIRIPEKVKYSGRLFQVVQIQKHAFAGDKTIERIHIGDQVRKVGDSAFSQCTGLRKITFGKSLVEIGKKVLYGNVALKSVRFTGKKLKSVGKKHFMASRRIRCASLLRMTERS